MMRVDLHVHTAHSIDGVDKSKEILEYVRRFTRLDAVAFTDHNRLFPRKEAEHLTREYGILVIPGIELGKMGSGKHIVALNIDEVDVNRFLKSGDPCKFVEHIEHQGGLSIAAHPMRRGYMNFSELGFDAVEVINGACIDDHRLIGNPRNRAEIGCSDAHMKDHVGRAWTEIDGIEPERFDERTSASDIRHFTEGMIEKIKQGFCHARAEQSTDARYLNYGFSVGKKYLGKPLTALRSLWI